MLTSSRRGAELEAILTFSRARNGVVGVTGALISSFYTFAQLIEGPDSSIEVLMASINRDGRHRDVKVISVKNTTRRIFPNWSMAYSGNANYIDRHIEILLDPSNPEANRRPVEQLESLIEEFSKRLN
jgi:hypothetical protein